MSDLQINLRLTPKASQNAIQGWIEDENGQRVLKVSVTAVPEKGKANKALIKLLAKEWHVSKSSIEIIRGETDKNKVLKLKEPPVF